MATSCHNLQGLLFNAAYAIKYSSIASQFPLRNCQSLLNKNGLLGTQRKYFSSPSSIRLGPVASHKLSPQEVSSAIYIKSLYVCYS